MNGVVVWAKGMVRRLGAESARMRRSCAGKPDIVGHGGKMRAVWPVVSDLQRTGCAPGVPGFEGSK